MVLLAGRTKVLIGKLRPISLWPLTTCLWPVLTIEHALPCSPVSLSWRGGQRSAWWEWCLLRPVDVERCEDHYGLAGEGLPSSDDWTFHFLQTWTICIWGYPLRSAFALTHSCFRGVQLSDCHQRHSLKNVQQALTTRFTISYFPRCPILAFDVHQHATKDSKCTTGQIQVVQINLTNSRIA